MVEDDGETTTYQKPGATKVTTFTWSDAKKTLSWTVTGGTAPQGFTHVYATVFSAGAKGPAVSASKALGSSGSIHATA